MSMSKISAISATLAAVHLFKAVPPISIGKAKDVSTTALSHGIFFTPEAVQQNAILSDCLADIIGIYGFNIKNLNKAFKTFKTVSSEPIEKLFADQIMHYFTTYGFEALGIYSQDSVYIPNTVFDAPDNVEPIKVTVIKAISIDELKTRIVNLLTSGAALKSSTQEHLYTLITILKIDLSDIVDTVTNKEFKIRLYDLYGTAPSNAVEWLRYVVYKTTGATMLVKNQATFDIISRSGFTNDDKVSAAFENADLTKLAAIFHRYKLFFLAFKHRAQSTGEKEIVKSINKIRKLADKYHRPCQTKILDRITSDNNIDISELKQELAKVTIFKRISLANAILYRRNNPHDIAYFIRNGKAYVEPFAPFHQISDEILHTVMESILSTIRPHVEGKTVYIPDNMTYALPTSEKLFWNNIPFNSSIQLKEDAIIAVHWVNPIRNNHESRTDLDLHLNSKNYYAGWHNQFNESNNNLRLARDLIFTGDMTNAPAPKGATEAFYVSKNIQADELCKIDINNFTQNGPIEFQFVIDSPDKERINKNYLIDSHTMNFCMKNTIEGNALVLGFLDISQQNKKFYFTSASMSDSIVSRYDEHAAAMNSAMRSKYDSCLTFNSILKSCGAVFEKDEDKDWDINLDPQQVTADVFLSLLSEAKE